jgi:hypothetical protein
MTDRQIAPPTPHGWGWRRQSLDHRDEAHTFKAPPRTTPVPRVMDLSAYAAPVWDQGQTGSCTGHALAQIVYSAYVGADPPRPVFRPSPMYAYWQARVMDHLQGDSGASIRGVMKGAAQVGVCAEVLWPASMGVLQRPALASDLDAPKHRITEYLPVVQTEQDIVDCLAAEYTMIFGVSIFESWTSAAVARTGSFPMPRRGERVVGGHALPIFCYDLDKELAYGPNSWSLQWGHGWDIPGWFAIPLAVLADRRYASDLWTLRADQLG